MFYVCNHPHGWRMQTKKKEGTLKGKKLNNVHRDKKKKNGTMEERLS